MFSSITMLRSMIRVSSRRAKATLPPMSARNPSMPRAKFAFSKWLP